jgi:hypothetical protein
MGGTHSSDVMTDVAASAQAERLHFKRISTSAAFLPAFATWRPHEVPP